MSRGCTAPDCVRKHYARGLCRTHYLGTRKGAFRAQPQVSVPEAAGTKFIPPTEVRPATEIKIGEQAPSTVQIGAGPAPAPPAGPPAPPAFQINLGTGEIDLFYEWLNSMAPDAPYKIKLTPQQRTNLDAAFAAAGLTTTNPWIVIAVTIGIPLVLFVVMNYEQLSKNIKAMVTDMKKFGQKKKEPEKNADGHPAG